MLRDVGSLTSNLVTQLGKVRGGGLAKTANDQCNIPPLNAIRLHFSVHRAAGVPSAQGLGVLIKAQLDAPFPLFNLNVPLRYCPHFAEVLIAAERARGLARRKRAVEHQVRKDSLEVLIVTACEILGNST
jgi:hypothetical protein